MTSPHCIGFVMDGNRRWARGRGLPVFEGHRAGFETLKKVLGWCKEASIPHVVVYAFSTENRKRDAQEVQALFSLAQEALQTSASAFQKEGVAVHVVGEKTGLPASLIQAQKICEEKNPPDARFHLWLCFNYGGRAEILAGVQSVLAHTPHEDLNEATFRTHLWTRDMPDPDIIVRTGGEKRLSGFLLWQGAYAELCFLDTLWPDFSRDEFTQVLAEVAERERRFGV
jgi:undecaprenyl diphosphate synthase